MSLLFVFFLFNYSFQQTSGAAIKPISFGNSLSYVSIGFEKAHVCHKSSNDCLAVGSNIVIQDGKLVLGNNDVVEIFSEDMPMETLTRLSVGKTQQVECACL